LNDKLSSVESGTKT